MDAIGDTVSAIERVLKECVARYATDDARMFTVFDPVSRNFLVIEEGWVAGKRLYNTFVHVQLEDGEVRVLQDFTNQGIANDLAAAGIRRDRIVLSYKAPLLRQNPQYAVA